MVVGLHMHSTITNISSNCINVYTDHFIDMFVFGDNVKFELTNPNNKRNWKKYTPRLIYGSVCKMLRDIRLLYVGDRKPTSRVGTRNVVSLSQQPRKKKQKRHNSNLLRTHIPVKRKDSDYAWSQDEFNKYIYVAVKALRKDPSDDSSVVVPTTTSSNRTRSFGQFTCFQCDDDLKSKEQRGIWATKPPAQTVVTKKRHGDDKFLFQFLGTCHGNKHYPGVAFKIILGKFFTL